MFAAEGSVDPMLNDSCKGLRKTKTTIYIGFLTVYMGVAFGENSVYFKLCKRYVVFICKTSQILRRL